MGGRKGSGREVTPNTKEPGATWGTLHPRRCYWGQGGSPLDHIPIGRESNSVLCSLTACAYDPSNPITS